MPLESTPPPQKLLDRVRRTIRMRHYSRRTEEAYVHWIRRFIVFHQKRHPDNLDASDVTRFLSWLATSQHVSASTQNQALSAILFLYKQVLETDLGSIAPAARGKTPTRAPVVLTPGEVALVLRHLDGVPSLVASLLYGSGLRLQECLELRVKDIDVERHEIAVRRGKGQKDRRTMLPTSLEARLQAHLAHVKRLHERDLAAGYGRVVLPFALARKYPNADRTWAWQFVFPAGRLCRDARWGPPTRFHLHESAVQRAVAAAAREAGSTKQVSCHTFRHSFATDLLRAGHDIRTVQELLGHADVTTTMVYTHVLNRGALGVGSPLDRL